jgi:hypothetical protein
LLPLGADVLMECRFINTFANSVGLKNLGWRYYFV